MKVTVIPVGKSDDEENGSEALVSNNGSPEHESRLVTGNKLINLNYLFIYTYTYVYIYKYI